jgi:hypothetical protein
LDFLTGDDASDLVYDHFEFPLKEVCKDQPFNISALEKISLVFDKSEKGVVVLDHMGWRWP